MANVEEIVKFVISSNLEELQKHVKENPPIVSDFPLCNKWRKNISLLHLTASYGSLTSITYLLDYIDVNTKTEDVYLINIT